MKKILLFVSLFSFGSLMAQVNITPSNYHINKSVSYFMCDSILDTYVDVTGTGVTWNYDTIAKIEGEMRTLTIKDSTDALFTEINKFVNNNDKMHDFLKTSEASETRYGMNIGVPDIGFVNAYFTVTPKVMQYPFVYNDLFSDSIAGSADVVELGLLDKPLWGKHYTHYDGFGTLKVGNTTIENVSRIHLFDTLSVDTEDPGIDTIMVILDVFEYYQFDVSTLPVFQVNSLQIGIGGQFLPMNNVFSMFDPSITQTIDGSVAVVESAKVDFQLAPNPAKDHFRLVGDFNQADVRIIDNLGKVVYTGTVQNGAMINTSELNRGLYIVKAVIDGKTITKKLIKQ